MKIENLDKLLEDQLKDLYSAENQLIKALPKIAKAASTEELKEAITSHLEETRGHAERLTQIGEALGIGLTGKKCAAMEGLLEEGKEGLEVEGPEPILDLGIIAAAQRVEHYEIAAYGNARAIAEQLGHSEAVDLLQQTLDEEAAADKKLTDISQDVIFPEACNCGSEEEGEKKKEESNGRKMKSPSSHSKQNGRRKMAPASSRR